VQIVPFQDVVDLGILVPGKDADVLFRHAGRVQPGDVPTSNVTPAALKMRRYRIRRKAELTTLGAIASAAGPLPRTRAKVDQQHDPVPQVHLAGSVSTCDTRMTQTSSRGPVQPDRAAPGLPRVDVKRMARRVLASGQAGPSTAYTLAQVTVALLRTMPHLEVIELS
jgi:hypothetical protein